MLLGTTVIRRKKVNEFRYGRKQRPYPHAKYNAARPAAALQGFGPALERKLAVYRAVDGDGEFE